MDAEKDYVHINRELWNKRTPVHLQSEFYNLSGFMQGQTSLQRIELDLLGNINGKSILHLQCHFGQDTLSLARMGARVTGVDLSDEAVSRARDLAAQLALEARFLCCNVYDLPDHLGEQFDIVFTSYGTIGWLPDLDQWAGVIDRFLKPGGRLLLVEFHPLIWMFDNDFTRIQYSYFKTDPIVELEEHTYADSNADIKLESVTWNHSLSEVQSALLKKGLRISHFSEYDYSPYACFRGVTERSPKEFIIETFGNKVPMVYALEVRKEP